MLSLRGEASKGKKADPAGVKNAKAHRAEGQIDSGSLARKAGPGRLLAPAQVPLEKAEAASRVAASSLELRRHSIAKDPGEAESVPVRTAGDKRQVRDKLPSGAEEAALLGAAAAGPSAKSPLAAAQSAKTKAANAIEDEQSGGKKAATASTEPKLSLLDLRRSVESRREASKADSKASEGFKDVVKETKATGPESGREIYRELSLDTRGSGDAGSPPPAGKTEAGKSRDFQTLMADRMREAWNGDIVQSAHIVLRDGDAGIIRLRLRPESLGNVKIELNLSENNISGRIVVESDEAKTAFEKNMNQLADAFKQGGFDSARLEVSVGGGSGGGASGGGAGTKDSSQPFFSGRLLASATQTADPASAASAYSRRSGAVDILA